MTSVATKVDGFKDFVLDQLAGLDDVTGRAMFGGYGLYYGETFFGILHKGRLYFKTNETSRAAYREHGMKPFRPNRKQTLTSYYEVPVEIIEDAEQLAAWAGQAIQSTSLAAVKMTKNRAIKAQPIDQLKHNDFVG